MGFKVKLPRIFTARLYHQIAWSEASSAMCRWTNDQVCRATRLRRLEEASWELDLARATRTVAQAYAKERVKLAKDQAWNLHGRHHLQGQGPGR